MGHKMDLYEKLTPTLRDVFNNAPPYVEQVALLLVISVAMFGASAGVRDAGHIGMELLEGLLPKSWNRPLTVLIHLLTLLFGGLMAWNCGEMFLSVRSYMIPTLGVSESLRYVPMVVAGLLIMLFSIEHIVALQRGEEVKPAWH